LKAVNNTTSCVIDYLQDIQSLLVLLKTGAIGCPKTWVATYQHSITSLKSKDSSNKVTEEIFSEGRKCNNVPNDTNECTKGCPQLVQQLTVLVIRGLYVEHR